MKTIKLFEEFHELNEGTTFAEMYKEEGMELKEVGEKLKEIALGLGVKTYKHGKTSLGRESIGITLSLQDESEFPEGVLMNSPYAKIIISERNDYITYSNHFIRNSKGVAMKNPRKKRFKDIAGLMKVFAKDIEGMVKHYNS